MLLQIVAGRRPDAQIHAGPIPTHHRLAREDGRSSVTPLHSGTNPEVRHPHEDPNNLIVVGDPHTDRMFENVMLPPIAMTDRYFDNSGYS